MRALPLLLATLLSSTVLAGCASERGFEPLVDAGWMPGYTFQFSVESHAESSFSMTVDGVEEDSEVEPVRDFGPAPLHTLTVFNTGTVVDGVAFYLALAQGGDSNAQYKAGLPLQTAVGEEPQVVAIRKSDLQPYSTQAYLSGEEGRLTATDRKDPSVLRFPMAKGDSWQYDAEGAMPGVRFEASVGGLVKVAGPQGEVDAVHVRHDLVIEDKETMRKLILAEAEDQGIDVNDFDFDISHRIDIYYAPTLHSIVRQVTHEYERFYADFEQDGNHSVFEGEDDSTVTVTLTGVSLTAGPERSLLEALQGKVELPPIVVTPPTGGPSGPFLRLTADQTRINAAEAPTVRFSTAVTGNVTGLRYSIVDAEDGLVDSGSGGSFEQEFDEPGTFTARVEGSSAGARVWSEVTVFADYEVNEVASCTAAAQGLGPCDPIQFPMRAGIVSLTVMAVRSPLAGEPGIGRLVLEGPDGETHDAPMSGTEATITLTDAAPGEWTLTYEPTLGLAEDIEYVVRLVSG